MSHDVILAPPIPAPEISSGFDVTRWVTQNVVPLSQIAERFANSGLVPVALARKPEAVFTVLTTGVELGLGPAAALRSIHVVEGRACLSADLMVGLAMAAGVAFDYVQNDDHGCVIEWKRNGSRGRVVFTMEDAKRAGLAGRQNWQKYPAAMCAARAKAAAARQAAPDKLTGIYTPDEIKGTSEIEPVDVATVEATVHDPAPIGPPTPSAPMGVELPPDPTPEPPPPAPKRAPKPKAEKAPEQRQSARLWALAGELGIQGKREVDGELRSVIYLGAEEMGDDGSLTFKRDEDLMGAAGLSGCPIYTPKDGAVYVVGKELNDEQVKAFADRLQPVRDKRLAMADAEGMGM